LPSVSLNLPIFKEPVELEVGAEDVGEDRPTGHERLSEVQVFPRQKFFLLEGLRSGFHLMPR
jgi:hypothetical protein